MLLCLNFNVIMKYTCSCDYRVFLLTWSASMQIYWNKRKRLHKKRVQLPQDWFGTQTWPPFHCFGTQIWPPWRHVKTLYMDRENHWTYHWLPERDLIFFLPVLLLNVLVIRRHRPHVIIDTQMTAKHEFKILTSARWRFVVHSIQFSAPCLLKLRTFSL